MEKTCIRCSDVLDEGINWAKSRKKKRHYICSPCFNEEFKTRIQYKKERKTERRYLKLGTKLSRKVTNFIQHSIKRDKVLDFSFEEIAEIMKQFCFYCGDSSSYSGLDRVDSSKGYVIGNVVPSCEICNRAKNTLTINAYIDHCKKVIKHWES